MSIDIDTLDQDPSRVIDREDDVAPFCLLRIAALPYDMLEAMCLQRTNALVMQLLAAEKEMEACKALLETAFFELIGGLDEADVSGRRVALALKRDIHNVRPTRIGDAEVEAIVAQLSPGDRRIFERWNIAQNTTAAATAALEPTFRDEIQERLRPALRAPLKINFFRSALAFASIGVARSAARETKLPTVPRPDNFERSLLGYLVRAAAKTSPFSSFMALSMAEADASARGPYPRIQNAQYVRRIRLNRGIVSRLHRAALVEAARCGDMKVVVNPTLRDAGNQRVQGLCDRDVVIGGRPWCEQRWAQFRLDDRIIKSLLPPPAEAGWPEWRERLQREGLKPSDAEAVIESLIERGVLQPPPLTDAFDEHPEHTLAKLWGSSGSATMRDLQPVVEKIAGLAASIAEAEADQRTDAVDEIRNGEQMALHALGMRQFEPFQNMVLEDFWVTGVEGKVGANLLEPLTDLKNFLATQMAISPYYQRLVDRFLREFGEGGECSDVVGFLLRVGDKLVDLPEFGAKPPEQRYATAPNGASLVVTAHIQIAACPAWSHPIAVANRVFEGVGWLAARFSMGQRLEQRLLRDRLAYWLRKVSYPREPVDLVLSGQCNDLQAHARLTDRVLKWPGEPVLASEDEIIHANNLRLSHNRETNLLELFDQDGTPISLIHLGSTFPSPTWGVRYALSILTQPFLLTRPSGTPPVESASEEIIFEQRRCHGKFVLSRAKWWVQSAYLRRAWFQNCGAARLVDVKRDCIRNGLPEVFFAQRYLSLDTGVFIPSDATSADRKPIWVDIRNPFCLSLLQRVAEDTEWVSLTEPLPGPDALWLTVDGRRHVSELQIEMVVRAKPDSSMAQSRAVQ